MLKFSISILVFTSISFGFTQSFKVSNGIKATLEATDSGLFFVKVDKKRQKLSKMNPKNFKDFPKDALFLIDDFNGDGYRDFATPSKDAYQGVNSYRNYYIFDPKSREFKLAGKNIGYLKREGKYLISYEKDGPFTKKIYYTIKSGKIREQKRVLDFGVVKRVHKGKRVYFEPPFLTIKSKKAYFYSSPDRKSKRKIYVIKGDRVKILDIKPFKGFLKIEYPSKKRVFREWIEIESVK